MKLKRLLQESNRDAFSRSLTREQKREIMDGVSKFNEFGSRLYKTNEISEMVEAIRNMTEGASQLALQETDGWFDGVTVKRDMKEVKNSTRLFEKAAKELSTLQQRLESVFEDLGNKLGKYYNINEAMDAPGKEDADIDNDGDEDESDEYLAKKRAAIDKAMNEAAPRMKDSQETKALTDLRLKILRAKKGGSPSRYSKDFQTHQKSALKSIEQMIKFSQIGV